MDDVDGREVTTAKLVSSQLEAEDLLHMVAYNFGLTLNQGESKSSLLLELENLFTSMFAGNMRPLLIIDEAQGLSLNALEELRLLTNLRIESQPMLQIFLVGQDELRDLVMDPRMEQVHQRLIATCHLEPLDFRQTAAYVMHRLKTAGWNGKPKIRAQIFPILYHFSHGTPRRINLFMGRILLHGWLEDKDELGREEAEGVFDELKQEHLVPQQPDALLGENLDFDGEDIDSALLMPDQKLGAMLMEKEKLEAHEPHQEPNPLQDPPRIKRKTQQHKTPGQTLKKKVTHNAKPKTSPPKIVFAEPDSEPEPLPTIEAPRRKRWRFWRLFG